MSSVEQSLHSEISIPSDNQLFGVTDPDFLDFMSFAFDNYRYLPDGNVHVKATFTNIAPALYPGSDKPAEQLVTNLTLRLPPLEKLGLFTRIKKEVRSQGFEASFNDMTLMISYFYAKIKADEKENYHTTVADGMQEALNLWGENPRAIVFGEFFKKAVVLESIYNKPKQEVDETLPKEECEEDLEDVLKRIDKDWVDRRIELARLELKRDTFVRREEVSWGKVDVVERVGRIIDFINFANKRDLMGFDSLREISPKDLYEGLRVVSRYFEQYPGLSNLNTLYFCINESIKQNPQEYFGGKSNNQH